MSTHKKDTKVWEWQRKSKTLTGVEADLVEQTCRGGVVSRKQSSVINLSRTLYVNASLIFVQHQ